MSRPNTGSSCNGALRHGVGDVGLLGLEQRRLRRDVDGLAHGADGETRVDRGDGVHFHMNAFRA